MPCVLTINDTILCPPLTNITWEIFAQDAITLLATVTAAPDTDISGAAVGFISGLAEEPTVELLDYAPNIQVTVRKTITDSCGNVDTYEEIVLVPYPPLSPVLNSFVLGDGGAITSEIDGTGSTGIDIRAFIDSGNDGVREYESAITPNTGTNIFSGISTAIGSGDLFGVEVSNDNFATSAIDSYIFPTASISNLIFIDNNNITVDISGTFDTFDTPTVQRNFSIQFLDMGGTPVGTPVVINGTSDTLSGLSFNLPAGIDGTTPFQIEVDASDEIASGLTKAILPYTPPTADALADTFSTLEDTPFAGNVATNDTLCSTGITTYELVSGTSVNGSVTSFTASTGNFVFTPDAGFIGTGSFQYNLKCDNVIISTGVVSINVTPTPIQGVDDFFNVTPNTQFTGDVSTNDPACPSGARTFQVNTTPVNGNLDSFDINTGIFEYTPNNGFTGVDSFTYDILCGGLVNDTLVVNLTVLSPNADAVNDTFTTPLIGVPFSETVTANDTTCDIGDTTYQVVSGSAINGSVTSFDSDTGAFTFTPSILGGEGVGGFSYDILCADIVIDTATVSITYDLNIDPDAINDIETATFGITTFSGDVSTNDVECEAGTTTTYEFVMGSSSAGATVTTFNTDGTYLVTFDSPDFIGTFTFQYNILCNNFVKDSAIVSVEQPDPLGDAVPDSFSTNVNTTLSGNVAGNDVICQAPNTTTYSFNLLSVLNGTVDSFDINTGGFEFTPTNGFVGTASFDYNILCNNIIVDTATVTITVEGFTAVAVDDSVTTDPETNVAGDVSTNDTLCSSGVTTFTEIGGTEVNGNVIINPSGTFTFTPDFGVADTTGSFDYNINCEGNVIDTGTVTVNINPYLATAVDDPDEETPFETVLNADVSTNDVPCNVGTTTYQLNGTPVGGTVVINTDGTYTFTPTTGFSGTGSFMYDLLCSGNVIDTGMVTIEVSPDLMPVVASFTCPTTLDTSGSVGPFVGAELIDDGTGTILEDLGYTANTGAVTFNFTSVLDGNVVRTKVATDALGANEQTQDYFIPDSSASFVGNVDDLSNIVLDITGIFDGNTTTRTFLVEAISSTNVVTTLATLTGSVEEYLNQAFDLSGLGITDCVTIRITASDELGSECSPTELDRCASLPTVDFNAILNVSDISLAGGGEDTWTFDLNLVPVASPVLNAVIVSVTSSMVDTTVDISGSTGGFVQVEVLNPSNLVTYDSGLIELT